MGLVNTSTQLARDLVRQMIAGGVTNVVVSPGSRNAPLSIALFAAQQAKLIEVHVRIDERTAAFFALGIAKASNKPVAVVCTSGTAAANYHPAILEAHHSQVPLLVITADRPEHLRKTGANQTTMQMGLYGGATTFSADVAGSNFDLTQAFAGLRIGPVHLNVQFDEPLLPDDDDGWLNQIKKAAFDWLPSTQNATIEIKTGRGVIVIGHDRGGFDPAAISNFAREIGWPVVAEDPLTFPDSIAHASLFLTSENTRKTLKPDVVIVIGRTTLSRSINALVKSAGVEIVLDPRIKNVDTKRSADHLYSTIPTVSVGVPIDNQWRELWNSYSKKTIALIEKLPAWSEASIARNISRELPKNCALFISSSRPIRDIEGFASARESVETFANRGLAGIDGNISTALGIATQRTSTFAIVGDLSFLHDMTGLIGAEAINCRILVINNDGGGIFSTLPQSGTPGFEVIFGTPHGLDPAAIAQSMGISAVTVKDEVQLTKEMGKPIQGLSVIVAEVPSREENAMTLRNLYSELL